MEPTSPASAVAAPAAAIGSRSVGNPATQSMSTRGARESKHAKTVSLGVVGCVNVCDKPNQLVKRCAFVLYPSFTCTLISSFFFLN